MSDLASAWRFRLPQDDPIIGDDEWNFDWLNPECSTGDPTPRTFHATLFLITYHTNDPWHDLTNFFIMLNRTTKRKLSLQKLEAIDESRAWISVKEGGEQLLEGTAFINTASMDPNVGLFAQLWASTEPGWQLCTDILLRCTVGYASMFEHNEVKLDVGEYKFQVYTGIGPNETAKSTSGLATRFVLWKDHVQMARCHLSYKDISGDASVGPTIEWMAVNRRHRGKDILPLFYHFVLEFIRDKWTMETLNNDAPHGHIMVKATHLTNLVVDAIKKPDGTLQMVTDKEFFYDYCGWSVRLQKGVATLHYPSCSRGRLVDEEASVYFHLRKAGNDQEETIPIWQENRGSRACDACNAVKADLSRCSRCRKVYYCGSKCQKRHWKQHKLWCNLSKDELRQKLVDEGKMAHTPNGDWVLNY